MKYVKAIAVREHDERKRAILNALEEIGVGYELQSAGRWENIRVPLNASDERLVIGAHYDNYPGSTGANDNASSCSILLWLIKALKNTDKSLEFVFFDGEERGGLGSRAYLERVGKRHIAAMLNLDVCGHGSVICMEDNSRGQGFYAVTDPKLLQAHQVYRTGFMPFGDDKIFRAAGIPTVALCVLREQDAALFRRIGGLKVITYADNMQLSQAEILTTMHNGRNDSISSVEQAALDAVTAFLLDALK